MHLSPLPTQISGARFLAGRRAAMLADSPRVGKTGAAIIAADLIVAQKILVITTASGRAVWLRGFADWSVFSRTALIATPKTAPRLTASHESLVAIVGWPSVSDNKLRAALLQIEWDLLICDEDHYAKNFDAKRTQAVYGVPENGGGLIQNMTSIAARAKVVWPLTGTPYPHDLSDGYVRLRALAPKLLAADPARGWPDVTKRDDFLHRYCVVRMKKISNFNRIPVVIGGKNEDEFKARFDSFSLRRTQKDVGIRPPSYGFMPLIVTDKELAQAEGDLDRTAVLEAARNGETKALDLHLGPLRRITGEIKARAVVEALKDEFACGLDKIVLAYWHKSVGQILKDGLAEFGVVGIDGATPPAQRAAAEQDFRDPKGPRVFCGQIDAAGEAIDLSASAELWFVETVFSPKSMSQMSLRITNHTQERNAIVKVCTLEGSVDEAVQASLMRLWATIRKVME